MLELLRKQHFSHQLEKSSVHFSHNRNGSPAKRKKKNTKIKTKLTGFLKYSTSSGISSIFDEGGLSFLLGLGY